MTTDTIITDGLAAMADEGEFRRWCAKFACTGDACWKNNWAISGERQQYAYHHSLAELAFELRRRCWRTHVPLYRYENCCNDVAGKHASTWWPYWEANEMELCIAAIAALEGE